MHLFAKKLTKESIRTCFKLLTHIAASVLDGRLDISSDSDPFLILSILITEVESNILKHPI